MVATSGSLPCNDLGVQVLTHFHDLAVLSLPQLPLASDAALAVPSVGVFLSPVGLTVALVLLLNGVKDGSTSSKQLHMLVATREAMASDLNGRVNTAYQQLLQQLSVGQTGHLQLRTAMFLRGGAYQPSFLRQAALLNASALPLVDHRDVQQWVESSSGGVLRDMGNIALGAEDSMLLTSTTTFHGLWPKAFSFSTIQPLGFLRKDGTYVTVDALVGDWQGPHAQTADIDDSCRAIKLQYTGGTFSAIGLLPRNPEDLKTCLQYLRKLHKFAWQDAHVEVWLPAFEIESELNAASAMRQLGLEAPFDSGEDVADVLYIAAETRHGKDEDTVLPGVSTVLHKAAIKVDGAGADRPTVGAGSTSKAKGHELFRFDRPFIWAVRHDDSEALVMAGIVVQPSGALGPGTAEDQGKQVEMAAEKADGSKDHDRKRGSSAVNLNLNAHEIKHTQAAGQQQGNVKPKGKANDGKGGSKPKGGTANDKGVEAGHAQDGSISELRSRRVRKRRRRSQLPSRTHQVYGVENTTRAMGEDKDEYYDVECDDDGRCEEVASMGEGAERAEEETAPYMMHATPAEGQRAANGVSRAQRGDHDAPSYTEDWDEWEHVGADVQVSDGQTDVNPMAREKPEGVIGVDDVDPRNGAGVPDQQLDADKLNATTSAALDTARNSNSDSAGMGNTGSSTASQARFQPVLQEQVNLTLLGNIVWENDTVPMVLLMQPTNATEGIERLEGSERSESSKSLEEAERPEGVTGDGVSVVSQNPERKQGSSTSIQDSHTFSVNSSQSNSSAQPTGVDVSSVSSASPTTGAAAQNVNALEGAEMLVRHTTAQLVPGEGIVPGPVVDLVPDDEGDDDNDEGVEGGTGAGAEDDLDVSLLDVDDEQDDGQEDEADLDLR